MTTQTYTRHEKTLAREARYVLIDARGRAVVRGDRPIFFRTASAAWRYIRRQQALGRLGPDIRAIQPYALSAQRDVSRSPRARRGAPAPQERELAAGRIVRPNLYEFDTEAQARAFALALRGEGYSATQTARRVSTRSNVPWDDIEAADGYAFKYGEAYETARDTRRGTKGIFGGTWSRRRGASAQQRKLAAGRVVSPNLYEFDTRAEARMFASVLRHHGHSATRTDRRVVTRGNVPWDDIEWADANAFKYGGERDAR